MPYPYSDYAKTLYQITTETFRICGDISPDGTVGGRVWRRSEVESAVNMVIMDAVKRVGGLRSARVIPLLANVNVYDLPNDCMMLKRINMHGMEGWVVLPTSITEIDLVGGNRAATGDPYQFFREHLAPNQIGVLPIPYQGGSTSTRDSQYGLLRGITDADGNYIPFDSTIGGLRRIRGVPFERTGEGWIIREVISPYGNLNIYYIRSPKKMTMREDYPDPGVPEWVHKDLKYGTAVYLLRYRRDKLSQLRVKRFARKWAQTIGKWQRNIEHQGPMSNSLTPM